MNTLKIIQNALLNTERLAELEFTDLQKKVQNKDYIASINTFLSRLFKLYNNDMGINTPTTRVFLSAYVMMNHREVVTSNDTYAIKLGNHATEMVLFLDTLFSNKKVTLKDYNNFMNAFNRYIEFFQVWRERDSLLMARPCINSYFNIEMMIQQFENTEQKETEEQTTMRKEKISDLKRVLKKLRQNIKIIAGDKGLSFLETRDMPYFKDEEIFKSVEKTVRKAFWDVVSENFENEKYDQMIVLLGDLKSMITELVPKATSIINEMNAVIDTEFLTKMIGDGLLDDKAIQTYINYIIGQIVKLQSASEDKNTEMFKENIDTMFKNEEKRSTILKYFFENAFSKLEKIKAITLRIRAELKK